MTSLPLIDFWIFGPERGCLIRQVAVIRALLERKRVAMRLFIHPDHLHLAHELLPDEDVVVLTYPGGLQLVYTNTLDIDVGRTLRSLIRYALIDGWRDYNYYRKALELQRPVLILNDFIPLVPIYGRLQKIPVIGIYNYLVRETDLGPSWLERVLARGIGTAFRWMYRLHNPMIVETLTETRYTGAGFIPLPVIARGITRPKSQVRKLLRCGSEPLIFVSLGGGATTKVESYLNRFQPLAQSETWQFLLMPRTDSEKRFLREHYPEFILGDPIWVETQDIVAAADLVIARAGFTTVAESIFSRTPLLIWHLATHPEIRETENILISQRLAAGVLNPDDNPQTIRKGIQAALESKDLAGRLSALPVDGARQAADIIISQLENHTS